MTAHYACMGMSAAPDHEWYCPHCICSVCGQGIYSSLEDMTADEPRVYRGKATFEASNGTYCDILESNMGKSLLIRASGSFDRTKDGETSSETSLVDIGEFHSKDLASVPDSKVDESHHPGNDSFNDVMRKQYDEIVSACGGRAHVHCVPNFPDILQNFQPWYRNSEKDVLLGLSRLCCQGAIEIGRYACGSKVSLQIIHAASASGEAAHGITLQYSKEQKSSLRKIISACWAILKDSYEEFWDSRTGENLIPMLLQGSSSPPYVDFSGSYIAPLFINSTVVSVACFRLLGHKMAEIPLLATRREVRGCKTGETLLLKLQDLLYSFGVQCVATPATYCPFLSYLPANHPPGEPLPPPSQEKFGFSIASPETIEYIVAHGGLRIPGVPWAEKSLSTIDWKAWQSVLEETTVNLNRVSDLDARIMTGIIAPVPEKPEETDQRPKILDSVNADDVQMQSNIKLESEPNFCDPVTGKHGISSIDVEPEVTMEDQIAPRNMAAERCGSSCRDHDKNCPSNPIRSLADMMLQNLTKLNQI